MVPLFSKCLFGAYNCNSLYYSEHNLICLTVSVSTARNGVNHELLGLVSYGKGCGRSGYPGVYTKITAIYPWLKEVVWGLQGVGGEEERPLPTETRPNRGQRKKTTTRPPPVVDEEETEPAEAETEQAEVIKYLIASKWTK